MEEEWVATPPTALVGLLQLCSLPIILELFFVRRMMEEEWVATPPTAPVGLLQLCSLPIILELFFFKNNGRRMGSYPSYYVSRAATFE